MHALTPCLLEPKPLRHKLASHVAVLIPCGTQGTAYLPGSPPHAGKITHPVMIRG